MVFRRRRTHLLRTYSLQFRSTGCALLGGSDDLHHSHEVSPLNSASPNPWKPDWKAATIVHKPSRRTQSLTPGLPTVWDSPRQEIDPQASMGANPWNLTSGRVPQIIKPASRRVTPKRTVPNSQRHQLDSWASVLPVVADTGVHSHISHTCVRTPLDCTWNAFSDRPWFTPCIADDWIRLAFHRPVSCGRGPAGHIIHWLNLARSSSEHFAIHTSRECLPSTPRTA
jgi:hypothetical protein